MAELDKKLTAQGADNLLALTQAQNAIRAQIEEAKTDAWRIRQASTAYSVGNKVIVPGKGNFDLLLTCTQAGTTGAAALDYTGLTAGKTITDGTVKWQVTNRDTAAPVTSVNGKTGAVTLTHTDVGAEAAGAVAAHNSAEAPHPGKFEAAGAVTEHNASGVAHWELFRGKISKPTTGSAGQYLKLNSDGSCSWADIDCVPVGTIFPFASAQPPAGAYLLNGQTIANCQTLYPQFWAWISAEATAGRVRTVADNAAFESELTAKGNCGAFVLNAGGTAGAVRLPSVTAGFIMGGTASQTGTTEAAGLPNITGAFGGEKLTDYATGWGTGAFTAETFNDTSAGGGSSGKNTRYAFSAANSNSIYGASSTVQPPAVRFAYCIKVYNATSALSEQDAAQLASLMQLKADTGLSNLTEDGEAKIKGVFTPPTSTDLNTVDAFNGFARFPSGMIMQWGESLIQNKETTFDIVFPVTFPNRCFTVVVGTKIGGNVAANRYGAVDKMIQMVKATTSGATFFQQGFESNSEWVKGCWIAIGN